MTPGSWEWRAALATAIRQAEIRFEETCQTDPSDRRSKGQQLRWVRHHAVRKFEAEHGALRKDHSECTINA